WRELRELFDGGRDLNALGKCHPGHGMIHRAAQHHHRRLGNAVGQLSAVIIRRGGIAQAAFPGWGEIRKWEMSLDLRIQLLELILLAHCMVIATDVPLLIIPIIYRVSHAPQSTRSLPDGDAV